MSRAANNNWATEPKSGIVTYLPKLDPTKELIVKILRAAAGPVLGDWLDAREADRMPVISRQDFNFTPYQAPAFKVDAEVAKLMHMLTYKRKALSLTDEDFIDEFIRPYGPTEDDFGNLWVQIGDNPNILWSCHTDTVHHTEGRQAVQIKGDIVSVLHDPAMGKTNCLGADDAAGIWLLTQMMDAQIEGLYVFHRDEEAGGHGSRHILKTNPHFFEGIEYAIAFDRKGYDSIITHQGGDRTASQAFAESFAAIVPIGLRPDDGGTFTDTAVYTNVVGECSNISVGYHNAHGPMECLDLAFIVELRDALLVADFSKLVCERLPGETEHRRGSFFSSWVDAHDVDYTRSDSFADMVSDNPDAAADYLEQLGVTKADFKAFLNDSGYA